jgi:glycosyltransferase involved in cell wall biosynthesis
MKSIVGQTYHNLEIILVDDGSPDRCPEMCDRWAEKDPRIQVIHQKNAGQGIARNAGRKDARGEYICFFDSDDYVDTTLVEKCVKSALENQSDAVLFGRWDVSADGHAKAFPLDIKKKVFRGEAITTDLLPDLFTYKMGLGVGACGRMYRLSVLTSSNILFTSERKMASEDAYFALRFFNHATCVSIVPEQLYYYCSHDNSFSRAYQKDRQEKNDSFLTICLDYIKSTGMPEVVASHLKVRYHYYTIAAMKQILQSELPEGDKKKALWSIFHDNMLRQTITNDALRLENRSQQAFFILLKYKCYSLCYLLLSLKAN